MLISNNIALSKNNFINFKFLMKFTIDQIKNFVVCHIFPYLKNVTRLNFSQRLDLFSLNGKKHEELFFFLFAILSLHD